MCWLGKWEELDDEEVVIHPACPAGEAKVFQPNAGICPTIVFYDVMRCLKALWETHITHVASKRLGPWPLGVEAVPLSVCTLSPPPPPPPPHGGLDDPSGAKGACLDGPPKTGQNLGWRRHSHHHGELRGSPLSASL
jgi:hypothetical protein